MDVHKPKPVHSWREFLTEVGTIVLGILIALSLEQMVETWRVHRQYREAREAIREELGFDAFNIMRRRAAAPCIARRIQEIGTLLDQADDGKPFTPVLWIGDDVSYRMRFSAEPDAGRSGLFTPEEQQHFGVMYGWLHALDVSQDRERLAWARLRTLEGRARLSPELAAPLRLALADARFETNRMDMNMAFLNRGAQLYDIPLATHGTLNLAPEILPLCLPTNTPLEEATRRSLYPLQK
jgi:hypothetical protein